jgi:hypothetical protein
MSLLKMQALLTADESGFLLIPNVLRAWAPQVQTPIHRHRQGRRDNISAISGISVSPRRHRLGLYYLLFYANIGQDEVCVFLRELEDPCCKPTPKGQFLSPRILSGQGQLHAGGD